MRETKFRGMDIDGRWFYGNLAVLTENVRHLKKGHYISNKVGMPFAYQVRPETVGEYTGLTDRNGKEIYEGDIVDDSYINPMTDRKVINQHIVEWDGVHRMKFIGGRKGLDRYLWMQAKNVQVIGNIYENPELLQEGANG